MLRRRVSSDRDRPSNAPDSRLLMRLLAKLLERFRRENVVAVGGLPHSLQPQTQQGLLGTVGDTQRDTSPLSPLSPCCQAHPDFEDREPGHAASRLSNEEKTPRQAVLQHTVLLLVGATRTFPHPSAQHKACLKRTCGFLLHHQLVHTGQKSPKSKSQLGAKVSGFYTLEKQPLFNPEVGLTVRFT